MSSLEDHIDLFDNVTKGQLSKEELAAFENRLNQDAKFKAAFDDYNRNINIIKSIGIRNEMRRVMTEANFVGRKHSKLKYLIPLAIAASISIILIFFPTKTKKPSSIFDQYFELMPDLITVRAQGLPSNEAMVYYETKKFDRAIQAFIELGNNDTTQFYKAISQLALKQPELAIEEINQINMESRFFNSAQWYKGLGFLLLNKLDSVDHYMSRIKEGNPNYEASRQILKSIR